MSQRRAPTTLPALLAAAVALALAAVLGVGLALPAGALARAPAASCQPYASRPCLFPYPDNRLTVRDRGAITGLRVHLPAAAMPVNGHGVRVSPGPYDAADGFSPGSAIVIHIRGLDNARALQRTGAVPLTDLARTYARRAPIVLIDQRTGRRQLIWAEIDSNATHRGDADLLIHPAKLLAEGHTFIVALRHLKTAGGHAIKAPPWFARLRDGGRLPRAERPQRKRYAAIFRALRRDGIAADRHLYAAWSFTVESRRSLTERMLAIRNSAFAQLGDDNLSDGVDSGHAPSFTVSSTTPESNSGQSLTVVKGSFQVPCYLLACGPATQPGFHYGSSGLYPRPTETGPTTTNFECIIPAGATAAAPARVVLYGHGLLGSADEITSNAEESLAVAHDMVICSTDFWGLANADTLNDAGALGNLNLFGAVIDRLQQGALNMLFLGRLMLNPGGLASSATFQQGGRPLIETSSLYYYGNSQGGIQGGFVTALSPDVRRSVLGVTGIDYANLLVQRSTDFAPFGTLLYGAYKDQSLHPLLLDLMQQLWDRGEPDGYAEQMTTHPLPDTPSHTVLMQLAYGDHQVSMYAGAVEARTIGASAYQPALDLVTNRRRDRNLFYGLPAIRRLPFGGSAVEIWDSGPGHTQPPPLGNLAPVGPPANPANQDPHEDPRITPAAQSQISAFLQPAGSVIDVCGGRPCRSYDYTP
ncbi:MAG: hypothetical protein ACRDMX_03855 [Solirubrobacteraceae bacterium]